jgi:hypothetical protein
MRMAPLLHARRLLALSLLVTGRVAAQSSEDLSASETLWRLGQDATASAPSTQQAGSASPFVFEAYVSAGFTGSAHEPRTSLAYDIVQRPRLGQVLDFRTDELLQPSAARVYASARVSLHAEWEATDWLLLQGLVDSGQIRDGATLELPLPGVTLNGSPALDALRALDPESLSPREALDWLFRLKDLAGP